jgi:hypothetical protein
MSIRPMPCAPAIVSRLWMSSTSRIATPLIFVGTPRSKSMSTSAGVSSPSVGAFVK